MMEEKMYRVEKDIEEFLLVNGKVFPSIKRGCVFSEKLFDEDTSAAETLVSDGYIREYEGKEVINDGGVVKIIENTDVKTMIEQAEKKQAEKKDDVENDDSIDEDIIVLSTEKEKQIEEIAEIIRNKYSVNYNSDKFYVYHQKTGIYEIENDEYILSQIEHLCRRNRISTTTHFTREVIEKIKRTAYVKMFEEEPYYRIPFQNGYYDLKKKKIYEYSPDVKFLNRINVEYDENAKCEKFIKFLSEITDDEGTKELILEMMAYTLLREYPYPFLFILVGEGANGKSTLLNLMTNLLGEQNVSHVSLHELEEDRFATAQLHRKFANMYNDLSSKEIKHANKIKNLTGNDEVMVQNKFEKAFTMRNYAKLIFACNSIPSIDEISDAVMRRLVVITFSKQIPLEKQNPHLLEELIEEKAGILNLLLEKVQKIYDEGFAYQHQMEKVREEYENYFSSTDNFIDEHISYSEQNFVKIDELYLCYKDFCRKEKLLAQSKNMMLRTIRERIPLAERKRIRDRRNMDRRIYAMMKIRMQNNEEYEKYNQNLYTI